MYNALHGGAVGLLADPPDKILLGIARIQLSESPSYRAYAQGPQAFDRGTGGPVNLFAKGRFMGPKLD